MATEYCIACYRRKKYGWAFILGVAFCYNSVLLYFLRPSWGFATIFTAIPVVVSMFHVRRGFWLGSAIALASAVLAFCTLIVPEQYLIKKFDPTAARFLPGSIFIFHAKNVRNEMAWELAQGHPAYKAELLKPLIEAIDNELTSKHYPHYLNLGYDADRLLSDDSVRGILEGYFGDDTPGYNRFCYHYFLGAWRHRPGEMLRVFAGQMRTFVVCSISFRGPFETRLSNRIRIGEAAQGSIDSLTIPWFPKNLPHFNEYLRFWPTLVASEEIWAQCLPAVAVHIFFRLLFSPVLYLSIALLIASRRRPNHPWVRGVPTDSLWFGLYLYSFAFWNTLSYALTVTTEISRYMLSQLSFSLLFEAWVLLVLLEHFRQCQDRKRQGVLPAKANTESPV